MPSSSVSFSWTRCARPSHSLYSRSSSSRSRRTLRLRVGTGISPFCLRIVHTVLRLRCSRRAISFMLMPSWCSRNTALRLSASIMEFPYAVGKSLCLTQDSSRQQIRLGVKGGGLQAPFLAFAHHPQHVFLGDFQVLQQHPFKLVASVRILGHLPHGLQHQSGMSFPDGLAERSGPTKVAVRQLFNLPHAELLPAQGQDELLDVLLVDPVHAHELPQHIHVGIDRESAAEDLLPHPRAHLCEQPQPHAHPRLAPR